MREDKLSYSNQSNLPGAKSNAEKMKNAFESIGIAILWLHNASLEQVSYNCLDAYFTGHGSQGDMFLSGDKIPDVLKQQPFRSHCSSSSFCYY